MSQPRPTQGGAVEPVSAAARLVRRVGGVEQLRQKCRGALVGVVVGDALGGPFEGHLGPVPSDELAEVERDGGPLAFTDDTAMTVAMAQSLLGVGHLDEDHLAATFCRHWEREPYRGYGAGAASLLARASRGERWRELAAAQFGGQGSFGNGAAMRVGPAALHAAGDVDAAAELGRRTAVITHTHPLAVEGAAVQAAAVAAALAHPSSVPLDRAGFLDHVRRVTDEPLLVERLGLVEALMGHAGPGEVAERIGAGIEAHQAVPAAICSFLRHPDSYREAVRFAIGLGGDTDTVAAMAGAVAGACGGEQAIPTSWVTRAEGADLARHLGDRFADRITEAAWRRGPADASAH